MQGAGPMKDKDLNIKKKIGDVKKPTGDINIRASVDSGFSVARSTSLPKKIGAPPKRDPRPGERFTIATRVRPELKRRLDAAAAESGRSQAQETELRLERSFDRTDLLSEVLTLAYGKEIALELMRLGAEMKARAGVAEMRQPYETFFADNKVRKHVFDHRAGKARTLNVTAEARQHYEKVTAEVRQLYETFFAFFADKNVNAWTQQWDAWAQSRITECSGALVSLINSNPRGPSRQELEEFLQKQLLIEDKQAGQGQGSQ
jgi:hypothetical protein